MKQTYYQLPEADCERLKRSEMQALRWSLAAVNSVAYAQEDLADRLDCIPQGRVRWRLMLGHLRALCNDIVGTIPEKQKRTIRNTLDDMELRMVPKFSANTQKIILNVEDLSYLVAHAKKDICSACILTDDECRECELYKILEAIAPREDWGSKTVCPYLTEEWWDK